MSRVSFSHQKPLNLENEREDSAVPKRLHPKCTPSDLASTDRKDVTVTHHWSHGGADWGQSPSLSVMQSFSGSILIKFLSLQYDETA